MPRALLGWSATAAQRFRRRRPSGRLDQQLRNVDRQCFRQTVQEIDGRVFFLSFKPTHIGPINASVEGELLLREPALHPDPTQIPCNQSPPAHTCMRGI
jgi:hypothetical protein